MKKIYSFSLCLAFLTLFAANSLAENYDLSVAGKQVTDVNRTDILGDGKVSYDPITNTLTLNNATIVNYDGNGIENRISNLVINVIGSNTVTADGRGACAIGANQNFCITGGGSLVANAGDPGCGILARTCGITIANVTITANAQWGISGMGYNDETLTIKNATIKAIGTDGSICDFISITLEDCTITQPAGAVVDGGAVKLNGKVATGEVIITSTTTAVENAKTNATIYAKNGKIFGADDARIYDILGRDVTKENGTLKGVFVVKNEKSTTKIIVK